MRARLGRLGAAGVVVLLATGVALLARPSVSWSVTPIVVSRANAEHVVSFASVRDEAFVLHSPRAARAVVRAWAGRHAGRAAVGHDGRVVVVRRRASVIWREGARVGLLILRRRASFPRLRADAIADARFADAALTRRPLLDAWQRVLDGVDHDGSVSRDTALAAFLLVYGALPDVRTPRGRHAPIRSGSLAALWALENRSQMTGAQRAVVDRQLGDTGAAWALRPRARLRRRLRLRA